MRRRRRAALFIVVVCATSAISLVYLQLVSPDTQPVLKDRQKFQINGRFTKLFQNDDGKYTVYEELEERRTHLEKACAKSQVGKTENILVFKPLKMAYCVVPKAGCTLWIRIFRYLNNDTAGHVVHSPFDIDRNLAHDPSRRTMKMYRMEIASDAAELANMTRFMFSRNPYSRLWSAYVDKFILPDMWFSAGLEITNRRHNKTSSSLQCGHDVSFEEFLKFIIDKGATSPENLNGHWRPISHYCNPCIFKPHIVANQETFSRDIKYILKHFHLTNLLEDYSHNRYMKDEIRMISGWNFERYTGRFSKCYSKKLIATRLWKVLQINGFLPLSTSWSHQKYHESNMSASTFIKLAMEARRKHPANAVQWKRQRTRMMVNAYKQVSKTVLDEIVKLFSKDFEYFGYKTSLPKM